MRNLTIKTAIFLAILLAPLTLGASTFLNTQSPGFETDTVYNDDVFITGVRIKFDSQVLGDLFAFGYEVVQTDSVLGSFNAFAYSAQNLGPVMGSYRAFARTTSCNTPIGRNLLALAQEITVGPQADIGLNADLVGASVVYQGKTANNLTIRSHSAVVSGFVGGNLRFQGDSLTINPNTVIQGNLFYVSPERAAIGVGAVIGGQTDWKKLEIHKPGKSESGGFWSALTWIISLRGYLILASFMNIVILALSLIPFPAWLTLVFLWVTLVISGNILILIAKERAWSAERILNAKLFPSMGLGSIALFLTPMVALVLFFTALASPLAVILIMLFGVAVFLGMVYVSLYIGRRICLIFGTGAAKTPGYLCYSIGITILLAISLIPYLGYLIVLAAIMAGIGGLAQTFWDSKTESENEEQPVATA